MKLSSDLYEPTKNGTRGHGRKKIFIVSRFFFPFVFMGTQFRLPFVWGAIYQFVLLEPVWTVSDMVVWAHPGTSVSGWLVDLLLVSILECHFMPWVWWLPSCWKTMSVVVLFAGHLEEVNLHCPSSAQTLSTWKVAVHQKMLVNSWVDWLGSVGVATWHPRSVQPLLLWK